MTRASVSFLPDFYRVSVSPVDCTDDLGAAGICRSVDLVKQRAGLLVGRVVDC